MKKKTGMILESLGSRVNLGRVTERSECKYAEKYIA